MTPHANRRSLRIPGWYIGLALMLASAAIVAGGFYLFLVWFLSRLAYIPSLP